MEKINAVLKASPFHGEGYRKVWARLRHQGIRTSKRRVFRLMRVHGLLAPHRVGHPHGPRAHDGKITTECINEMGGDGHDLLLDHRRGPGLYLCCR